MKALNNSNKMMKALFIALASLVLMNTACQKNNNNNGPATVPPPAYPNGCPTYPCGPTGGQLLYSGGTTNGMFAQATFQVSGEPSGNGPGYISGTVTFNNWVCQIGMPNLAGPFTMQMAQQGFLSGGMFTGMVVLTGPTGQIPASVQVVPPSTMFPTMRNYGLFALNVCGQQLDMNF